MPMPSPGGSGITAGSCGRGRTPAMPAAHPDTLLPTKRRNTSRCRRPGVPHEPAMKATTGVLECDRGLLERLNRLSLTRSFTPQLDVDWDAVTTDAEFETLYPA